MNTIESCDFCDIKIGWEESDDKNGKMWNCEKCGSLFCEKCSEDAGNNISSQDEVILCPNCYKGTITYSIQDLTTGSLLHTGRNSKTKKEAVEALEGNHISIDCFDNEEDYQKYLKYPLEEKIEIMENLFNLKVVEIGSKK